MSVRDNQLRVATVLVALSLVAAPVAASDEAFPEARPADRTQAARFVASQSANSGYACLTARIDDARHAPYGGGPALRRALSLLDDWRTELPDEHVEVLGPFRIRYTGAEGAPDRLDLSDRDGNGRSDALEAVLRGLTSARELLGIRIGLPGPREVEVLLADLGGIGGYRLAGPAGEQVERLAIDVSSRDVDAVRRSAVHQYAHASAHAQGSELPAAWAEALAVWTVLAVDGLPDGPTTAALAWRSEHLGAGLFTTDPDLAAGNALWLSFLHEAYGPSTLRAGLLELTRDPSGPAAFDRALRRTTGEGLPEAFREFQLWTVLVGDRADRQHFPFAASLASVGFASSSDGLPALSVQSDPAVAPWGGGQIRLDAKDASGGLRVHFEGDLGGRWEADLLLFETDGTKRRHRLELDGDQRGETTVPLGELSEVLLLVRNVDPDEGTPRRYTYAAHEEPEYPFEMVALEAWSAGARDAGVTVHWETATEQDLVGFNILRVREDGGRVVTINPIWIPALGDPSHATTYQFLDRGAEPGLAYLYRVQGITRAGLSNLSDPVLYRPGSER